jgi:hypothetical protein
MYSNPPPHRKNAWLAKTYDYLEAERILEASSSVPIGSIKEPEHTNRRHMFHKV